MTLPRRSSFVIFLIELSYKLAIIASVVTEPLRSRIRNNALRRTSAANHERDSTLDDPSPMLVLMVYRAKNVQLVRAFLRHVKSDADVRLWALDEIAPELSSQTVGCGPGTRFVNLNRLYNAKPIAEGSFVVVADDDALFVRGGLTKTISLMKRAGFALAQPGQSILGWWTTLFNVSRPLLVARDTNFVEMGPVVIADPLFAKHILPFREDDDMGWGIEAEWYRAKEGRFRIGIIDDCRVVHWSRNATAYPAGPELQIMRERLSESGIGSIWQLQSVNGYWWKWQRFPSWRKSD